jgi:hypothetical protein
MHKLIQPHINVISHHHVNTSTWLSVCITFSDDEKYYNLYKVQFGLFILVTDNITNKSNKSHQGFKSISSWAWFGTLQNYLRSKF